MRKEQHNHIVRAITPTETMSHEGDSLWWLNTWLGHWLVITTKPGSGVELKLFPLKYLLSPPRGSDPASPSHMEEPGMKTICGCKFCFVSLLCIWHDITSFHPSLSCPGDVLTTKEHVELQVLALSRIKRGFCETKVRSQSSFQCLI